MSQYFVGHPFDSTTTRHLLGMLATSVSSSSEVITRYQAFTNSSIGAFFVFGLFWATLTLICCHRFSMGLRSGHCAGHGDTAMFFSLISWHRFAVWLEAYLVDRSTLPVHTYPLQTWSACHSEPVDIFLHSLSFANVDSFCTLLKSIPKSNFHVQWFDRKNSTFANSSSWFDTTTKHLLELIPTQLA